MRKIKDNMMPTWYPMLEAEHEIVPDHGTEDPERWYRADNANDAAAQYLADVVTEKSDLVARSRRADVVRLVVMSEVGEFWPVEIARTYYVDALMPARRSAKWKWSHACHLYVRVATADDVDAALADLDRFAASIGMRRKWRHDRQDIYHYDLNAQKRIVAVKAGAVEADRKMVVEALQHHRTLGIFEGM